jgi:hypothetical protein
VGKASQGPSVGQAQPTRRAFQCLDVRLFIHTDDPGVGGRC